MNSRPKNWHKLGIVITFCVCIVMYHHKNMTENNNPTVSYMEPTSSKGHSMNFTAMEDLMLTMPYFHASEDSITGTSSNQHN